MDVQHALLSKIVLHQEMRSAVESRITVECFNDPRYQRVYGYMLKHWTEYGTSPGEDVMTTAFPAMPWEDHVEPTLFFINAVLRRRKHSILLEGLTKAANYLDSTDPDAVDDIERLLSEALVTARLETNRSFDLDFTQQRQQYMELLAERRDDPGYLRGISTGFHGIDFVTGGLQPEHFIVLIGTPKSFKSATALAIAMHVHEQGKVPLYIGFEMSNTEQQDRLVSLLSGVGLTRIMNGHVKSDDVRAIRTALRKVEDMRSFIFSSDITSAMTVGGIQAKIQEYQPDVVIIDGVYMMTSELAKVEPGSPQALTSISRGLKRLAQATKIPILVTTQASLHRSKGGLSISSAMYSQSWGQDADILLGVERQKAEPGEELDTTGPATVKFRVLESRSGPRKDVLLEWDWNEGSVEEIDPQVQHQLLNNQSYKPDDDDDEEIRP
jgi:replicative DNA helicase